MSLPATQKLIYNAHGTVDMEIDHPQYGWIPFTADPNDTEQLGKDLYATAIAGTLGLIAPYVPTLDVAKTNANARVDAGYNAAIAAIVAPYPSSEQITWTKQEDEARAYTANAAAATPLLSAIGSARGLTVAVLAARVIGLADAYAAQGGALIGQRQARQDAIAAAVAANDIAALDSVVW